MGIQGKLQIEKWVINETCTTNKAYLFLGRGDVMIKGDTEITPERAEKIKQALIRQYEDQYGVEVISYQETKKDTTDAPA